MTIVDQIEAVLFVSDAPIPPDQLAAAIGATEGQVEQGIEILEARLAERGAVALTKIAGGYQLCTKPEHAVLVANYLKPQRQRLSRSLMEVLAIVAYRQPITMTEIEQARGVQSDYSVQALRERRLIGEVGRRPVPGRPVLYGTTDQFLHQFKLNDLADLPEIAAPSDCAIVAIEG